MSAAASSTSRLANSPASGGGFDRPQVAITIGLEWRLPPARADRNNMAEYRELEQLVARIQRQLAPKSKVIHNAKLLGRKTQRMRQIDVLVQDKVAQFDINIVIDCKDYKNPVDVKGVEEFYGLLDDVGAQKGVLGK